MTRELELTGRVEPQTLTFGYSAHSPRSPSYGPFHPGAMPPGAVLSAPYVNYMDDSRCSAQLSPTYQSGENCPVVVSELDTAERPVAELPVSDPDPGLAAPSRPLLSSTTPPLGSYPGTTPIGSPPIPERRDNGSRSRRASDQSNLGFPNGPPGWGSRGHGA